MNQGPRATRLGADTGEPPFTLYVDGQPVSACPGQTIGVALLLAGHRVIRRTSKRGDGRGLYCAMGVCWDCAVLVDGRTVRACLEPAAPGRHVETLRRRQP